MSAETGVSDWDIRTVGSLGDVRGGKRIPKGYSLTAIPTPHPYIRVADMRPGGVEASGIRYVPEEVAQSIRAYRISPEDIFISVAGTLGIVGRIPDELDGANLTENADRITSIKCDTNYLMYSLLSEPIQREIDAIRTVGAQPKLALGRIKQFEVPIPMSQFEQARIAGALVEADEYLALLECLIAKKQAIKQGLMQQLLSGRTRLPEFTREWTLRRVGDMGTVLAGKALNTGGPGPMRPYLRTKNVLDGRIDLADVLEMPMTAPEFQRFSLERGDVLLNEGQSLDLVGRCSLYDGELGEPCAMQNQLLRFRAFEWTSPQFAAHLFRNCQASGTFASIATKTTSVAHLGSSRFCRLELLWPIDQREQAAVAGVLDDADREIAVLGSRLTKARSIKLGMMQQLLTGRTRLPVAVTS